MAFTNTVETVGDAALTRSIIDRSITELNDNISVSIRQQAFRACSALASVNFPNVTNVALGAFWQCTALAKADFASCVTFANNAFYGCTALTALILRCTDQLCTITGTPFAGSAIANGTGYIYVPAVLLSTYKSDSAWSPYASQIREIESYPEICDPYTWEGVLSALNKRTYASVYKVGDLVPLDLGSEGQINMQIAGIDVDDLADGSGKAPISWISKELLKTAKHMNPAMVKNDDGTYQEGTGSVGGWEKSELRAYMRNDIKQLIPEETRGMIRDVTKYTQIYDANGTRIQNMVTSEDVWIPSGWEMAGSTTNRESLGPQYNALFVNDAARMKHIAGDTVNYKQWWLRTTYFSNYSTPNSFWTISLRGSNVYNNAMSSPNEYNFPLCFCT